VDDFTTAKMAFTVLSRMAVVWGGSETAQNGVTASQGAIPGFNQFMFTRFSPLCWVLPSSSGFNPKDALARQVLGEAGGLQQTIYTKAGTEYADYLRSQELPGVGMGPELVEEYVNALTQFDAKGFRAFFLVRCVNFFKWKLFTHGSTVFHSALQFIIPNFTATFIFFYH
jgi:exportin-T